MLWAGRAAQERLILNVLFLNRVANQRRTQNTDALLGVIGACFCKPEECSRATLTAPDA